MSREILVVVHCDNCDATATEKKPVSPVVLTIEGRTKRVDLCGSCEEGLVSPIRSVLFTYGVDPEPQDLAPEGVQCPLCTTQPANRKALATHLRSAHQTGIREMISQGLLEPARKKD